MFAGYDRKISSLPSQPTFNNSVEAPFIYRVQLSYIRDSKHTQTYYTRNRSCGIIWTPGNAVCLDLFQQQADTSGQIIIARLGYYNHGNEAGFFNSIAVILPFQKPIIIDQFSFSVEDQIRNEEGTLERGKAIHILETQFGKIAILSCHDYTHADALSKLIDHNIDILIVSTFNPASRLFGQYALADMHRFFCFVVVSNIANFGGSGVYAPFRRIGPKSEALTLGGTLALVRGECVGYLNVSLPVGILRQTRKILLEPGSVMSKKTKLLWYPPIFPGEMFMDESEPHYKKILQKNNSVETIDLHSLGYESSVKNGKVVRIGVTHLKGMEMIDYLNTSYHISSSERAPQFIKYIKGHLNRLSTQLRGNDEKLDFMVFPEVFLPLELESDLKVFAQEFNTIIISGVEYDIQPENLVTLEQAQGANRCFIYVPTNNWEVLRFEYTKLTRSQYDARTPAKKEGDDWGQFIMNKGDQLIRFSDPHLGQFGVLICYDFSHLDILHKIDREGIELTPELLFVVAYNPDSALYESCCIADSHRFYQYIVMCNVAQYGGSGVFGPVKNPGMRQTLFSAGIGAEGISVVSVDLDGLKKVRNMGDKEMYEKFNNFQKKPGIF